MRPRGSLTKTLAAVGLGLVWLPIAFTLFTSLIGSLQRGRFLMDYLMPAELFPAALLGGALLLWAAQRARLPRGALAWSMGLAIAALIVSQALAVVTGLASGARAPTGWPLFAVLGLLAVFTLALIWLGVEGFRLARTLSRAEA